MGRVWCTVGNSRVAIANKNRKYQIGLIQRRQRVKLGSSGAAKVLLRLIGATSRKTPQTKELSRLIQVITSSRGTLNGANPMTLNRFGAGRVLAF